MTIIDILVISGVGACALLVLFFYVNSTQKIKKRAKKSAELAVQKEKDKIEAEKKNAEKEKKEKEVNEKEAKGKETKVKVEVVNPESGHKTETEAIVIPNVKIESTPATNANSIEAEKPTITSDVTDQVSEKDKEKTKSLENKNEKQSIDKQIQDLSPELKAILFTDIIKPRF